MEDKKLEGTTTRVKNKAATDAKAPAFDMVDFGNRLKVPAHIMKELRDKGLAHRFVSIKKIQENGGYHPMGWTPYEVEKPLTNPLTGQAEKLHRVGDLVLAVKPKDAFEQHKKWLAHKSQAQAGVQKKAAQEMRDRIKEGKASKHISVIEGYEESDDDKDE